MNEDPSPQSIFLQALKFHDLEERDAHIYRVCGEDQELRRQVESLLAAHEAADTLLETQVTRDAADAFPTPPVAPKPLPPGEHPGDRIGHYKLLNLLGEGGFGRVWMAEQEEPVRRRVALKIVKLGMDTREVLARFDAERQALALMEHPGIAHVYDAGTTEAGRPYFVMELVHGVPITEYCDGKDLSVRERLSLFIHVCRAVQHAHQKGVIHRDIKPSNILVGETAGKAVPKVIDFGIAKAIDPELAERTLHTREGQVIGTPRYMSPEQTGSGGGVIDTRTDVYSLGIVLYELLTGSTPLTRETLKHAAWGEMERLIREVDPPKPSQRVTNLNARAAGCGSSTRRARTLRGDLDWIAMRALEKEQDHRYGSANDLARDLEHYLANEPVTAGPPTAGYRIKKFIRRNRAGVAFLAVIALVLIAATAVSSWQAVLARRSESQARTAESRARSAESQSRIAETQARSAESRALAAQASEAEKSRALAKELSKVIVEQGRAWLERSRTARANGEHRLALLFASRALGFHGYGRRSRESPEFEKAYPGALVEPIVSDPDLEQDRLTLVDDLRSTIDSIEPNPLPIWSSPLPWHHTHSVSCLAYSPDGQLLASGGGTSIKLWSTDRGDLKTVFAGHKKNVTSLAFSTEGNRLASGSADTTIKLWDVASGRELASFEGHLESVGDLAFHPAGEVLASASDDNTVKLWNIPTGELRATLTGHGGSVTSVTFSPDGKLLASGSWDETVIFWDWESGKIQRKIEGHSDVVASVTFSPDGQLLASGSWDKTINLWNPVDGSLLGTLLGHSSSRSNFTAVENGKNRTRSVSVADLAFSPDGTRLASGSGDETIKLWDVASQKELASFAGHQREVACIAFHPDGKTLASGSKDKTIRLWDLADGADEETSEWMHRRIVNGVAYSPDGTIFASLESNGPINLWNAAKGSLHKTLKGHEGRIKKIAFSPDGRLIAGSSEFWKDDEFRTPILVWDVATGNLLTTHEGSAYDTKTFAFQPDGRLLASDSPVGSVSIWNVETDEVLAKLEVNGEELKESSFSPDGTMFCGITEKMIRVWDAKTGQVQASIEVDRKQVDCVTFGHARDVLAIGSKEKIKLWNLRSGELWKTIQAGPEKPIYATRLAFNPDGTLLASASYPDFLLWDVASGKLLAEYKGHSDTIEDFAFSPDGALLLSGSGDGTVKLWDVSINRHQKMLTGHTGDVSSLAFSPDGLILASGAGDATVKLWDRNSGRLLTTLTGHAKTIGDSPNSVTVLFSPDGTILASGSLDNTIQLWDMASGWPVATLRGESQVPGEETLGCLAFSPDGTLLAGGGLWTDRITVWNTKSREVRTTCRDPNGETRPEAALLSLAFSPDGRTLAGGYIDEKVRLWAVASGRVRATLDDLRAPVTCLSYHPDGTMLAGGLGGGPFPWATTRHEVQLWDAGSGKPIKSLGDRCSSIESVTFSRDGELLAIGSYSGIEIWDVAAGAHRTFFDRPEAMAVCTFSPDRKLIACTSNHHAIRLCHVDRDLNVASFVRRRLPEFTIAGDIPTTRIQLHPQAPADPMHRSGSKLHELASTKPGSLRELQLRFALLAGAAQWRPALALWGNRVANDPKIRMDHEIRRYYGSLLISSTEDRFVLSREEKLSERVAEFGNFLSSDDMLDPQISLRVAILLSRLALDERSLTHEETVRLFQHLTETAPLSWLENLTEKLVDAHCGLERDPDLDVAILKVLGVMEDSHPQSKILARCRLRVLEPKPPSRDETAPEVGNPTEDGGPNNPPPPR